MHSLMGLVGAAGGAVVLTMEVVSLVTPEWVYFTRIADRSQGLWQLCTTLGCISYTEVDDFLQAVRIFMIIGGLLLVSGIAANVIFIVKKGSKDAFRNSIIAMFSTATLSILIAMAIFTEEVKIGIGAAYGYSFYLGWVSVALSFFLSITVALLSKSSN